MVTLSETVAGQCCCGFCGLFEVLCSKALGRHGGVYVRARIRGVGEKWHDALRGKYASVIASYVFSLCKPIGIRSRRSDREQICCCPTYFCTAGRRGL